MKNPWLKNWEVLSCENSGSGTGRLAARPCAVTPSSPPASSNHRHLCVTSAARVFLWHTFVCTGSLSSSTCESSPDAVPSQSLTKLQIHPGQALAEAALGVLAGPPKRAAHLHQQGSPTEYSPPETDREGRKLVLLPGSSSGDPDSPGLASIGSPFALVNWSFLSHTCDLGQPRLQKWLFACGLGVPSNPLGPLKPKAVSTAIQTPHHLPLTSLNCAQDPRHYFWSQRPYWWCTDALLPKLSP